MLTLCTLVQPLVSSFQPTRTPALVQEPRTEVKLVRALIDVHEETGKVAVEWNTSRADVLVGMLGNKKIASGKTKVVFNVRSIPLPRAVPQH